MSEQHFDPVEYKTSQRKDWDSVSTGWETWWETIELGAQQISDHLLELADIQPGHRVLDIATGIGEPALSAAHRVGDQGHVVATDQAAEMLAIARKRAQSLGLDNVSFREMDGEAVHRDKSKYNAVLCRWGLMFMPNVHTVLDNIYKVLLPDGRFAAAVWSTPDKVPSISLAMGVVRDMLDLPPPPQDVPSVFSLANTELLNQVLTDAGFYNIRIEPVSMSFNLASAEDYTQFSRDVSAPLKALVSEYPSTVQDTIWSAITEAVREYETEGGRIQIENEAICISGQR